MSVDENVKRASLDALRALNPRMEVLHNRRIPLSQRYIKLREISDEAERAVAPATPCHRGCSHCCYQAVAIGRHEASVIARMIGTTLPNIDAVHSPEEVVSEIERWRNQYTGVPCVFLENGECTIYDVRPVACRLHHSLEDTPEPCDTFRHPGGLVGSVDLQPIQNLHALVCCEGREIADIRDWFPTRPGKADTQEAA